MCVLIQAFSGTPFHFKRMCFPDKKEYIDSKKNCDDSKKCAVVMCDKSGCKADLGMYSEGAANPGQKFRDTSHFLTVKY